MSKPLFFEQNVTAAIINAFNEVRFAPQSRSFRRLSCAPESCHSFSKASTAASRPNAGHSCGRRTILKRAVRAAKLSRRLSVHAKHPLYRTQTARGSRQLIAVNRRSERLQFVESGHRKRKLRPQARYGQFARCAVLTRTASQNNATIRYLGCPLATLPAGSIAPSDWPKKLFRSTENRRVRSPGQVVPLLHILLASCRAIGGISPIRTLRRDFLKNAGIKDSQKSRKIVNSLFTN